jgi:Na+-transporting NADH:ubiquinone oxidoreductase subunit B
MKFLHKLLDDLEHKSQKGGPLHKIWPIIEAQDTGIRVPSTRTKTGAHVRDFINLKRMMITVVFALIPCLLFGIYNAGYQRLTALGLEVSLSTAMLEGAILVLPIVLVSYAAGAVWEVLFAIVRGHEINEGFLVSGMLFPLTLPPTTPLWMVAVGMSFGIVIGKEVFGGTGMNILNPALTARAFLFFAYPAQLSGDKVWTAVNAATDKVVDTFSGATPLGVAFTSQVKDDVVAELSRAGYSFQDAFFGLIPGSIGETSVLLCLVGAVILIATGVGSWRIMLSMLAGGAAASFLVQLVAGPESSGLLSLPVYYQLCLGSFAFGTVFMATDPVSAAGTNTGKIIYGFLTGALAITIRTLNPAYPEGVFLAILFMNVFAPLVDHYVVQANVKRRLKRA